MSKLYGGIDLHANNNVIVLVDDEDRIVFERQTPNDLGKILFHLSPYQRTLQGLVLESTCNWYWLVDGRMEAGYAVQLANTAAIKQTVAATAVEQAASAAIHSGRMRGKCSKARVMWTPPTDLQLSHRH